MGIIAFLVLVWVKQFNIAVKLGPQNQADLKFESWLCHSYAV